MKQFHKWIHTYRQIGFSFQVVPNFESNISNAITMTDSKSTCDATTMTDLSSYRLELEKELDLLRGECNGLREECSYKVEGDS